MRHSLVQCRAAQHLLDFYLPLSTLQASVAPGLARSLQSMRRRGDDFFCGAEADGGKGHFILSIIWRQGTLYTLYFMYGILCTVTYFHAKGARAARGARPARVLVHDGSALRDKVPRLRVELRVVALHTAPSSGDGVLLYTLYLYFVQRPRRGT